METLTTAVHECQRFRKRCETCLWLSHVSMGFGEQRQKMWSSYRCSCGMIGLQALGHLRNAFLRLSLLCQRPAAHDSTMRYPERKFLFLGEKNHCVSSFLGETHLAAELMEHGSVSQGKTQAKEV